MVLYSEKDRLWIRCKQYLADGLLKEEFGKIRNKVTATILLANQKHKTKNLQTANALPTWLWKVGNQLVDRVESSNIYQTQRNNFDNSDDYTSPCNS